jgi:hypothetical protein
LAAPTHVPSPFGGAPASTLWLGLYGGFSPHPVDDRDASDALPRADAYSLFVARSAAMDWLTDAMSPEPRNLWGMNEAERETASAGHPPLIGWFQVVVTEPTGVDRLLPLQPFLACAGDVLDRLGVFELQAAQLLLPPPNPSADDPPGPHALGRLAETAGWFANCDRRHRAPVHLTIDGGQVPTITSAAPEIFRWAHDVVPDAHVFNCDRCDSSHDASTILPGLADNVWVGPPRHRTTFSGTLVEWSLDAVGWTAAFLAHACHRNGVATPLVLTATRAADAASPPRASSGDC